MGIHKHRIQFTITQLEAMIAKQRKDKHWVVGWSKPCEICDVDILVEIEDIKGLSET